MYEKHLKKYTTSLVTRKLQMKTTLRFYLTPVRKGRSEIQVTADAGEDVEKEEHSSTVGEIVSWYNPLKLSLVVPQKTGQSAT